MNYVRVIPRDLFNESSLLLCYGKLSILLGETYGHTARLDESDGRPFDILQDENSGNLTIANLRFFIGGTPYGLTRPLNSREKWPLYAFNLLNEEDEDIAVFTTDGLFTDEFLELIKEPGS